MTDLQGQQQQQQQQRVEYPAISQLQYKQVVPPPPYSVETVPSAPPAPYGDPRAYPQQPFATQHATYPAIFASDMIPRAPAGYPALQTLQAGDGSVKEKQEKDDDCHGSQDDGSDCKDSRRKRVAARPALVRDIEGAGEAMPEETDGGEEGAAVAATSSRSGGVAVDAETRRRIRAGEAFRMLSFVAVICALGALAASIILAPALSHFADSSEVPEPVENAPMGGAALSFGIIGAISELVAAILAWVIADYSYGTADSAFMTASITCAAFAALAAVAFVISASVALADVRASSGCSSRIAALSSATGLFGAPLAAMQALYIFHVLHRGTS